jgi:hypothetical protein
MGKSFLVLFFKKERACFLPADDTAPQTCGPFAPVRLSFPPFGLRQQEQ